MGRSKRPSPKRAPCFVLTPATITLTQQALQRFEAPLSRAQTPCRVLCTDNSLSKEACENG
ncbi:MAG TPA: hypothetical protein VFV38_07090 [Ktedonobacteraceae bacterium]|nr:hypothetical protein [Ktedonobacteraceae bacterium]